MSYLLMEGKDLEPMILSALDNIEKTRKNLQTRVIDRKVKELNNGFFHKLFRREAYTREDAILHLSARDQFGMADWNYLGALAAGETERRLFNKLLKAALSEGARMVVDVEHYNSLKLWGQPRNFEYD